MYQRPISFYIIGVLIIWALLLGGVWLWGTSHFHDVLTVFGGFVIGQISMFIAVHFYTWK